MNIILSQIRNISILTKVIFVVFSLLFLVYLIWPGPKGISDFSALPNSAKSTLSGDTVELPNIVGFFSNNYRDFVLDFYTKDYQKLSGLPFPPIGLNYPPEQAFTFVKDQTQSTFLEQRVYPFRDSLYINGLEPFYEDGKPKYWGATEFSEGGQNYQVKNTLRYYPSPIWTRLVIWLGINIIVIVLWILGKKIIFNK